MKLPRMTLREVLTLAISGLVAGISFPALVLSLYLPPTNPPVFDVRLQYNQDFRQKASPQTVIDTLDELHVPHVLVSSMPNQGALDLVERSPSQVIPMLSVYRTAEEQGTWFDDKQLVARLERERHLANYRAIGEVHVPAERMNDPDVARLVGFAARHDLVIQVHANAPTVRHLLTRQPDVKILWASGGLTEKPAAIGQLLDRFPNLWVDLSHRSDIAPNRYKLTPEWRALFERHPTRFMVGSGTNDNAMWSRLQWLLGTQRRWLQNLPPALSYRIAYQNASDLFAVRASQLSAPVT